VKWAEALEVVNIFKYWQPADLVEHGTMPTEAWWVLGGIALVSLGGKRVRVLSADVA